MKSIKDISWQVSEEEYRQDNAYSYSTLAKFEKEGFSNLNKLFDKISTPSLVFGSLVDTLITEPDKFKNLFIVFKEIPISDTLLAITKSLIAKFPNANKITDISDEDISQIAVENNYYAKETYKSLRIKKIKEECSIAFLELKKAQGKEVIDSKIYEDALACVEELKRNEFTTKYFNDNPFDNNVEIHNQLKFKGDYEDIPVRCMFDGIIVIHDKKLIIPYDLKTSSKPEYEFPKSFMQWLYPIQSNLYTYILKQNIAKDEYFKDFQVANYAFIVINRYYKSPMVWIDKYNHANVIPEVYAKKGLRHWSFILKELNYYLTNTNNKYPIWVKKTNDIDDYIED